ncbi:MAG TPA: hypothetical protein VJT73_20670 [Polyangiaceae bacterium]|nr:hypothetical protein [Polyangiaceae bacterium]
MTVMLAFAGASCVAPEGKVADARGDAGAGSTWCDVLGVLEAKCQRCHREPPDHGAPFPLMTYADTQVRKGILMSLVQSMVLEEVAADRMPAAFVVLDPPVEALTIAEKNVLLGWSETAPSSLDCP